MTHVVIIGGGFGGLAAAHELRTSHPEIEVTLVDRRDHFFMGFAKLWDLSGWRPLAEGTRSLHALTGRGVRFVQAEVTAIDPDTRTVTAGGEAIAADAILVALGGVHAPGHVALLQADGAHDVYDAAALPAIHAELDAITEGRVLVSILGGPFQCPPAPFEVALIVDEVLRGRGVRDSVSVAISTPQPITLPVAGVDASRYVAARLGDHEVELLSERKVTAVDGAARTVTFDNGETADYSILLGVPALAAPPVLVDAGLTGPSGFVEPDRTTLRTSFPGIYAVGDCTHVPNAIGALPKAGIFAAAEGVVAARNIVAELAGGEEARFDGYGYCFLELPGQKVAFVEGDFFAEPKPDVTLVEADSEQFVRKQAYELERLELWLG